MDIALNCRRGWLSNVTQMAILQNPKHPYTGITALAEVGAISTGGAQTAGSIMFGKTYRTVETYNAGASGAVGLSTKRSCNS